MPSLQTFNELPQIVSESVQLSPDLPQLDGVILQRYPELSQWQDDLNDWWKKTAAALSNQVQDNSTQTNLNTQTGVNLSQNINVVSTSFAQQIITVSALASLSAHISVQTTPPGAPVLNDVWIDTSPVPPLQPITKYWDGAVWQIQTTPFTAAAVSAEQSARITSDGFLSGKYTLTVVAGNVVTGMNITSSSGGGTNVSQVIFQADRFQIYNNAVGKIMFDVSGSGVRLGATLVVDTTNAAVYIGTGTYANTNTAWYVDQNGRMSLKDKLTWDGTTLTIVGSLTATTGTIGGWTIGATTITSGSMVLDSAQPSIRAGQTAYNTGTGFWMGTVTGTPKFSIGSGSSYLTWDGTTLTITGSITVTGGNAAKTDFSNVVATYAGSPTTNGSANNIVSQGALATQSTADWTTQIINRFINNAGLIVTAPTPSGSGLFLGSDHLGYYTSGAWKTYMDSSGNFYLGGTSGSLQWNGSVLTISGAILLTQNASPSGSGLFIGQDFMGYYTGGVWKTYMDNTGKFYLGGTSGSLQWNGTTLTISGNITVTGGNAAKTDFSNVSATYAGSPSTGGAANTIVSQGTLATQNDANWTTQVSARPVELTDGRIAVALSSSGGVLLAINAAPSGSGLFLGNNFLGYYTGGSWKTYMDNSGNFYLGGVSGSLQWNGSTLTISGTITSTSGTIGGFTLGATTLSATNIKMDSNAPGFYIGNTGGEHCSMEILTGRARFSIYNGSNALTGTMFSNSVTNGGTIQLLSHTSALGITLDGESGDITCTAVSCTTVNTGGNTITCGAITCTSIDTQGNDINIGGGTFTCANVNSSNGDGYTMHMYSGSNHISFKWDGQFHVLIDATDFVIF